jgi:large subunit ribosomal protein L14
MIQVQTILNISDNSGAKLGRCIKIVHGYKNHWSSCNELVLVSIQKLKKVKKVQPKVKKGDLVYGVIIKTKSKIKRKNSSFLKFKTNSIVLLTKQFRPIGTRVIGPVIRELRTTKFMKIASLSEGFI